MATPSSTRSFAGLLLLPISVPSTAKSQVQTQRLGKRWTGKENCFISDFIRDGELITYAAW